MSEGRTTRAAVIQPREPRESLPAREARTKMATAPKAREPDW